MIEESLEILFLDDHYCAIYKPEGLLVHRSTIAKDVSIFALQLLRDQLGKKVYPVHRIDRATSGILIFALSEEAASKMGVLWMANEVHKQYLTFVRGFIPEEGVIDRPLMNEKKTKEYESVTHFKCLKTVSFPIFYDKYPEVRYSLALVVPKTGRTHQIRRHFAKLRHYIIGDSKHGNTKKNKFFREQWAWDRMMLHACRLTFQHPFTNEVCDIKCFPQGQFHALIKEFSLLDVVGNVLAEPIKKGQSI